MLSGGEESVLVLWQLETPHKSFLPRLSSSIQSIALAHDASASALLSVGLADASVLVLSLLDLKVTACAHGLKAARARPSGVSGLAVDPRSGLVALPGSPGSVQFYNVRADAHVMEVETVSQNRVSKREDADEEVSVACVTRFGFSDDGLWMATVDERVGDFETEVNLKFWVFDSVQQRFVFLKYFFFSLSLSFDYCLVM
jgi:NET1-associated nuclear protein 1 (U3 small nucleolar RNA-associated protein 17)